MFTLLASILVAIVLATGTGLLLYSMQKPVYQVETKPTARISDPGDNLVGPDWSGLYKVSQLRAKLARVNADEE